MKILGTGLNGLVGSRIVELLKDSYEFEYSDVDITDREGIINKISNSNADIVLHLAAKTSVDGCEEDKEKDIKISEYKDIKKQEQEWKNEKTAWAVNVYGTKNIADGCNASNKKIIYISTDFVFDGENCPVDGYDEDSEQNPVNWYGKTKYEGEKIVKSACPNYIIARIAYPYRANSERTDFARKMIEILKTGQKLDTVTDHIMTPTFIDDIAYGLDLLIKSDYKGIAHLVGDQFISPYNVALLIANKLKLDTSLIVKTDRKKYFNNRAERPFQLMLKNDKMEKLGVKMKSFEEGIEEIKGQLANY